jgi:hypothetical protein
MTTFTYTPTGTGAQPRDAADKLRELVSVLDYIPSTEHAAIRAGTSSYDAAGDFQSAADTGFGVFIPGGVYNIGSTVDLAACPILIGDGFGFGGNASKLVATSGLATGTGENAPATITDQTGLMLDVRGVMTQVRNLWLAGSAVALSGIRVSGGNSSVLDCLLIDEMRRDGIHFANSNNNSLSRVSNSVIRNIGEISQLGSATVGSGSTTITVSLSADLVKLIRPGLDLVQVGSSPFHTIASATTSQLTITKPFPAAASGTVEIRIGIGVAIHSNGDNSAILVEKNTFQDCKGAGLRDNGLYGAHARDNAYELNGYGRVIGSYPNGNIGAIEQGSYFETSVEIDAGADVMLEAGAFTRVEPAVLSGAPTGSNQAERIYVVDFLNQGSPVIEMASVRAEGRAVMLVNETSVNVDYGAAWHFHQSSAAANCVINLPAMTAARLKSLFGGMEAKILLLFADIGGRTFTIKSPDTNVNGVAGATGVAVTGNWIKREVRYDPHVGWLVTA